MFKQEQRTLLDNVTLRGAFFFLGGYIGVLTFLILGYFANCMSGNAAKAGISLGNLDFHDFFLFAFIVTFFIFGAFLSTKIIDNSSRSHNAILVFESSILIVIGTGFLPVQSEIFLAALAMGLQNGMTTYTTWNTGKVRTTHVTGTITDIGVFLANGDLRELGFTVFQALTYLTGAVSGFFVAQKFNHFAFVFGGIAILLIILLDYAKQATANKVLTT
ncbi:MAG: DUF1275 domain-containing protein [Candidatus Schekmanbacteria bacterium]|nr:DUF1275 domain-containing protein [Candidatus Schekmanbacteria bacterium]